MINSWCLESCPATCGLPAGLKNKNTVLRTSPCPLAMREMFGEACRKLRNSPSYMTRLFRAKGSCHSKVELQKVDLPCCCLHHTQEDVSVCFLFDLSILREREKYDVQVNVPVALCIPTP